ncbi:MAG TPA: M20/M25/M40 family metallo-hydrolase [Solirubrobacteraceae bacterium]|nr:M20/M25/M40 family metallo-hydrolase [Solirubrobacteraceae bacterium]
MTDLQRDGVSAPATGGERSRLADTFAELCRIESPFGAERACAERVSAELRELGLEVFEDDAADAGAGCGNLLVRIPSASAEPSRTLLLCAHLDTVIPAAPIEPVVVDGGWENANAGILGADNKAAVALLLELARRVVRAGPPPVGLELLFTVSEENALVGAKAFDVGKLEAEFGYVFDHASPIGEIVVASPTYYRLVADFRGAAAHAGIRPEDGRSAIAAAARAIAAMSLGRVDPQTTANIGRIEGGSASTNVVPDRCTIEAEARSLDPATAERTIAEMVDHAQDGANSEECDVDVTVEQLFRGYRTPPSATPVVVAEAALKACGYEPRTIVTGGGSDANAFEAAGLRCVNLANGTERNHEPTERVSVAALEGMLDVALALLAATAAC